MFIHLKLLLLIYYFKKLIVNIASGNYKDYALIKLLILFAVDLNTTTPLLAQASGQNMANMHYRKC